MKTNEKLRQIPLLRLLIPFIPGIVFYIHFFPDFRFLYIIIPLSILLVVVWLSGINRNYNLRWVYGILTFIMLFFSGAELARLHSIKPYIKQSSDQKIIAYVKNIPEKKQNSVQAILRTEGIYDGEQWSDIKTNILAYFQKDSLSKRLHTGDQVFILSSLSEIPAPSNPGEFDYRTYMARKKVYYRLYAEQGSWEITGTDRGNPVMLLAVRLRNNLLDIYRQNNIRGDSFSVLSALTLGYRDKLEDETITAYSGSGAMHILAVSGLHTGIIYLLLNYMLFFLRRYRYGKIMLPVILLLFLWFYALLTGLSPSVLRAVTMFSFIIIGKSLHRNVSIYNMLAASAFFLLLNDPYLITMPGFQLSYLAVTGIVYFHPKIYGLVRFRYWLPDKLWSLIVVSISAQIAVFPLVIYYFHQFPVYFILTNIIAIPLVTIILYMAVILFVLSFSSAASKVIANILDIAVNSLNYSVSFIEQLPFSTINRISFSVPETLLVYMIIVFISVFLIYGKARYLQVMLAAVAVFITVNIVQQYFAYSGRYFYIYNAKGSSVYNFINGKNNVLLSDLSDSSNRDFVMKTIENNWIISGLPQGKALDIDKPGRAGYYKEGQLYVRGNFLQFCNKRIFILDENYKSGYYSDKKLAFDYLIIAGNNDISVRDILENFNVKNLIIDPSNSYWLNKKITSQCEKYNIRCYSVPDNGCFCVEL